MNPNVQQDDRLLPLDEVRARLGNVSRASLYRIFNDGRLPLVKIGRRSLVRASDVQKFVASTGERR